MCWAPLQQPPARPLTVAVYLAAVEAIPAVYPPPGDPARRGLPSKGRAQDGAFLPPLSPANADATKADGPGADSIWGRGDPGRSVFADSWELRAQLEAVAKAAAGAQALAAEAVKQVTNGLGGCDTDGRVLRAEQGPRPWQTVVQVLGLVCCVQLGPQLLQRRLPRSWGLPGPVIT